VSEDDVLRADLIALFKETGPAHHRAYIEVDGYDPEWPIWYANYMQERLNGLIRTVCTRSELIYLLITVEKARAAAEPAQGWAEYYADFFVQRYGRERDPMPPAQA
jgi:hypothetical protein